MLSFPPVPIEPGPGETQLLEQAIRFAERNNLSALDRFPIPFAVVTSQADDDPLVTMNNPNSGAPMRVDVNVDQDPSTGPGGHDISVFVSTELFLDGVFNPHLLMTIDRLGSAPFASDFEVLISFPFSAFNFEPLPGDPNLFMGYKTTGPGGPDDPGGIAPLREEIRFVPNTLIGADHQVEIQLNTTDAVNPLQFITGHFDGNNLTGILNAGAYAAWVEQPPQNISIGVGVGSSGLFGGPIDKQFHLSWTASATSKVIFDYLEEENDALTAPDFNTTVTFNQMPTQEDLSIILDEDSRVLTLSHRANSPIGRVEILSERKDGLQIIGTLTDVPTEMDLVLDLAGAAELVVNDNTLDMKLEAIKEGGFLDTAAFLGYDIGYVSFSISDAPSLTAEYDPETHSFGARATNEGESIGYVELVIDDDAHNGAIIGGMVDFNGDGVVDGSDDGVVFGHNLIAGRMDLNGDDEINDEDTGILAGMAVIGGGFDVNGDGIIDGNDVLESFLVGLHTPAAYFDGLPGNEGELHHLFSVVDDGTHGTVIARVVRLQEVVLDLDPDATKTFHMVLGEPTAPMQAYLRFFPTSNIVPGHDIEITCNIINVPHGVFDIHFDGPGSFGYTTDPPQTIESIHCFGHVDSFNFDVDLGLLPPVFDFEFNPDSHLWIFAEDGFGGPANVGHVAIRFWDAEAPNGLPGTAGLLGTALRDARVRADDIPSSRSEWTQVQGLNFSGGAGMVPAVGSVIYNPTTFATAKVLQATGGPAAGTLDIGFIRGDGFADGNSFRVLDSLAVKELTKRFAVGQVVTGGTSGATGTVRRAEQLGGAGILYLAGVSGVFLNDEELMVDDQVRARADGTLNDAPAFTAQVNGDLVGKGTSMDFNTDETDVFLGGVQFLVSTEVELEDPLPVADPSAPHFVVLEEEITPDGLVQRIGGGAFGIDSFHMDTFSSLNLHYDGNAQHLLIVDILRQFNGAFFPPSANFQYELNLVISSVPQEFTFSSDLTTQFVYEASHAINSVTLAGVVDDTDDDVANGTNITVALVGLPSQVRFGYIAGEVAVINGRLDLDGNDSVTNADTGVLAGFTVINGRVDVNGDGVINAADAGSFFSIPVIGGELDIDSSGVVDGDDDGGVAGVQVRANSGINNIGLLATSVNNGFGMFGSDFRIIQVSINNVPAQFVLSYGGGRFVLETLNSAGNPQALGSVTAMVSTTNDVGENSAKVLPFTLAGPVQDGPVLGDPAITGGNPGGSRINYSHFLQQIDKRYYNTGSAITAPSGVLIRLAELYADGEVLNVGEDHLIVRMENLDGSDGDEAVGFASFQFSSFQRLSWIPNAKGGEFIFRAPGRGDASFFAGFEQDDTYTTFQIEHIPDEILVSFDKTEHLVYTASASPGEIDFYHGPGNGTDGLFAQDGESATRALMRNTPDSVRVFWTFSFPNGGAFMDASNEFEILFLTQDGSSRITAGLTLEDLHVGWGIEFFSFDVTKTVLGVPVAWELFQAKAGIDNDADGLTLENAGDPNQVGANPAKADVAGFFALYNLTASPSSLVNSSGEPVGPAPAANEYVPFLTLEMHGFNEFSLELLVELDPTNLDGEVYPIDIELNATLNGAMNFDIWSSANTNFTFKIPLIPEVGFVNPPDYTDNTPFHIIPGLLPFPNGTIINGLKGLRHVRDLVFTWDGFHTFNEHFDPFAGTPAPFTGSTGDGGFDPDQVAFVVSALGPFAAALSRWETALVDSGMSAQDAAGLIADLAANTEIVVHVFPAGVLGDATGDSDGATIRISQDAGGFGWFIDLTPFDDTEFAGGPPPADLTAIGGSDADGKIDMLTFFIHEVGHLLGLHHSTEGVMQSVLPRGVRRLPIDKDLTDFQAAPAPDGPDTGALVAYWYPVEDEDDDEEEQQVSLIADLAPVPPGLSKLGLIEPPGWGVRPGILPDQASGVAKDVAKVPSSIGKKAAAAG